MFSISKSTFVPVCILVRVSTVRQDTDRQVSELQAYAEKQGYTVIETCYETITGKADESKRDGLHRAEELARSKLIHKVLVHEVSRLARMNSVTHKFVETLETCGVSLYWHAQGCETLLPSGKRNPAASIMLALLAEMARGEVEILGDRIRSGLAEARRKGVILGRPEGSTITPEKLLTKHRDIVRQLNAGQSLRNVAKITGKGLSTVKRVKSVMDA